MNIFSINWWLPFRLLLLSVCTLPFSLSRSRFCSVALQSLPCNVIFHIQIKPAAGRGKNGRRFTFSLSTDTDIYDCIYIRMIKYVRVLWACIHLSASYDKKNSEPPTFYLNRLNTSDLIFILFHFIFLSVFALPLPLHLILLGIILMVLLAGFVHWLCYYFSKERTRVQCYA